MMSRGGRSRVERCWTFTWSLRRQEPWPLERVDKDGVTPTRAILRADKESNVHHCG